MSKCEVIGGNNGKLVITLPDVTLDYLMLDWPLQVS